MSIDRIYRCDWRECERHCSQAAMRECPFLTVTGDGPALHFCGWDCVLRFAGAKEPEEIIEP